MRTGDFDFELPVELIAQQPAPRRDQSRLLVLRRESGTLEHKQFPELAAFLREGDVLALNDSRVIPARLRALSAETRRPIEVLLLEEVTPYEWWAMLKPGRRARSGTRLLVLHGETLTGVSAVVTGINEEGHRRLRFEGTADVLQMLELMGEVPLPPYIERAQGSSEEDRERYQTIYARPPGSVAAPTAGLHFTGEILDQLRRKGVHLCFVTLHVGAGTFAPVKSDTLAQHRMHEEKFELSKAAVAILRAAKERGRKVLAAGTTTLRVLESAAAQHGAELVPYAGRTSLFIYPPYEFKIVNALLTNFHLPRSTLLMLASAFAAPGSTGGRELMLRAYAEAIRKRYRFFSYGDAMLLI